MQLDDQQFYLIGERDLRRIEGEADHCGAIITKSIIKYVRGRMVDVHSLREMGAIKEEP